MDVFFSKEEILNGFDNYEIPTLVKVEVTLAEDGHHNGIGLIIHFAGKKESLIKNTFIMANIKWFSSNREPKTVKF